MSDLDKLEELTKHLNEPRINSKVLHRLLDHVSDAYWIWEVESGYDYLSEGWQRMLGYGADELPHRVETWEKVTHPDDLKKAYQNVQDHFLSQGKIPYDSIFRMKTKQGLFKLVRATGAVVKWNDDGSPRVMAGRLIDLDKPCERPHCDSTMRGGSGTGR